MNLTDQIDYFFSAFCISFFDGTKYLLDKYTYKVPLDVLPESLRNIKATKEEIIQAIQKSTYLKIKDDLVIVPMPQKPFETCLILSPLPKCLPSFKAIQLLKEIQEVQDFKVYNYILKQSIEQLSFCIKFNSVEDKLKFKQFFKEENVERLSKKDWNNFHSYMKQAKKFYETINQTEPIPDLVKQIEEFKKKIFVVEFCPQIIERHIQGVTQFQDVKQFRRENHKKDYLIKKGLWKDDINQKPSLKRLRQSENTRFSKPNK